MTPTTDSIRNHAASPAAGGRRDRSSSKLSRAPIVLAAIGVALFSALGVWQVERRAWKLDLIQRVEHRIHAAPVTTPGPDQWPAVTKTGTEYERVAATGQYLNDRETLVQAVTEHGGGFWVMTPFRTTDGFVVLVNRGFVPPEQRDPATRPAGQIDGPTNVTGLVRMTEPHGGFLRTNDPAGGHWYSRDVGAIATARGFTSTAPYFIDADAVPGLAGAPVGGLTVIAFPNNHLVYALTWFGLALMSVGAGVVLARERRRRGAAGP